MRRVYTAERADARYWDRQWQEADVSESLAFFTSGLDYHRALLDRHLPRSGLVADVGCGLARVALHYRRAGYRTIGIDVALGVLRMVKSFETSVPVVVSRAESLPVRRHSLAAYVGLGVFEYDERGPEPMLSEACEALAPGGLLYLTVPYVNLWRTLTRRWPDGACSPVSATPPPGLRFHLHVFKASEILGAVERTGFEIVEHRPVSVLWGLRAAFGRRDRVTRRESASRYPQRRRRVALLEALRAAFIQEQPRDPISLIVLSVLKPLFANSYLVVARKRTQS